MGLDDSDELVGLKSLITGSREFEYTYHIPAPPRIVIPPLVAESNGVDYKLRIIENEYIHQDLPFLKAIDLNLEEPNRNSAWEYNHRRTAQKILPYLYLGPISVARDKDFLKRENLTMLLAARYRHGQSSNLMAGAAQAATDLGIDIEYMDVQSPSDVVGSFSKSVDLINQHMSTVFSASVSKGDSEPSIGKVLVFCESGNGFSAAIVVSYLMSMLEGVNHIRAMQLCQARRFSAHFNELTKPALQSYWDILCARRDVSGVSARYRASPSQADEVSGYSKQLCTSLNEKRSLFENDQNGGIMDCSEDVADAARFEGRSIRPFSEVTDTRS